MTLDCERASLFGVYGWLEEMAGVRFIWPDDELGTIVPRKDARFLDFVAMSDLIGRSAAFEALEKFDELYPQPNGQSARQQLQIQLANPMPYDLDETNLREYKKLRLEYRDWSVVAEKCRELANGLW